MTEHRGTQLRQHVLHVVIHTAVGPWYAVIQLIGCVAVSYDQFEGRILATSR